jgi:hypothetical protein
MVIGGSGRGVEVELVPLDPVNATIPACLKSLGKFPVNIYSHMGTTVSSGT